MKRKILFMLSALAIALPLSLSLQSCGDDDDDPQVINTNPSGDNTGNNGTGGDDTGGGNTGGDDTGGGDTGGDDTGGDGTGGGDTGGGNTGGNASEAIDLGLPSGIKWASRNLGASTPEEYGDYYAWGETETKENYSSSTSTTFGKTPEELKSAGIVGDDGNLTPAYDVAHVKLGGKWRMPTFVEIEELCDNCTWTWTTQNGVKGRIVTSKTNGNSIFLPAAGIRSGTSILDAGDYGYCWSSTLSEGGSYFAYYLGFGSDGYHWSTEGDRYDGRSVRPVSE